MFHLLVVLFKAVILSNYPTYVSNSRRAFLRQSYCHIILTYVSSYHCAFQGGHGLIACSARQHPRYSSEGTNAPREIESGQVAVQNLSEEIRSQATRISKLRSRAGWTSSSRQPAVGTEALNLPPGRWLRRRRSRATFSRSTTPTTYLARMRLSAVTKKRRPHQGRLSSSQISQEVLSRSIVTSIKYFR